MQIVFVGFFCHFIKEIIHQNRKEIRITFFKSSLQTLFLYDLVFEPY